MLWEETREKEVEVLHGDGQSMGFLLQQDARGVTKQHIKDLIKSVPHFSLAVLDKPEVRETIYQIDRFVTFVDVFI